jgi:hypothetical protein
VLAVLWNLTAAASPVFVRCTARALLHQTSHRVVELTQRRASDRTATSRPPSLHTVIQGLPLRVRTGRQTRCIAPRPVRCVIVHSL